MTVFLHTSCRPILLFSSLDELEMSDNYNTVQHGTPEAFLDIYHLMYAKAFYLKEKLKINNRF
jgi:hypothetical protein